jgi:hypothetical protein
MKAPTVAWQATTVFFLSLLLFVAVILWLDNVHVVTMTGMFKSIQAEPWIADPGTARLDASNYLFFPLYGLMCRLLDALGIYRGMAWKQFALLNAFWASLCVALVHVFTYRLWGNARAAALAACFHAGCGFVLLLAVINEDIMPGYTMMFAAMALAGLWFDRPTPVRVIAVGALFTAAWLIEWRLIFPTLPALVLALLVARQALRQRLALVGVLLLSIVALAELAVLAWHDHNGPSALLGLLWTGKGIGSGWAGFSLDKAWLMLWGVSNYFLLTFAMSGDGRAEAFALAVPAILQISLLIATAIVLWPRRGDARVRALAVVFLGTFAAGEVFNFYSQPQDPQMQVNVMPWLTVAWGILATALLASPRARTGAVAALAVLSLAPLAWNVAQLSRHRGQDAASLTALAALETRFPPQSTVFVYWGFENIATWQYALWSHTWDWNGKAEVTPAPSIDPRFKWIAITGGAIRHPMWSPEQHAASIKRDIDLALDRGYQVAIADVWTWTAATLGVQLAPLSAADHAPAIHAMLHQTYEAKPAFNDPTIGAYYLLRRREGP